MTFQKNRAKKKVNQQEIANERIEILLGLADTEALSGNLNLADDYVKRAREIGMRCNARIASNLKRKFCKYCYAYLLPGKTSVVRINSKNKRVVVKCLKCDREIYFPYVKEKKEKKMRNNSNK